MFEEGWENDVEVQWEFPLTENSIRVEVIFKSRKMVYKHVFKYVQDHIRFVYTTLFYLSYIIHAPTLKNYPSLTSLPKSGRISVCVLENTLKSGCTNSGRLFAGATIFQMAGV